MRKAEMLFVVVTIGLCFLSFIIRSILLLDVSLVMLCAWVIYVFISGRVR